MDNRGASSQDGEVRPQEKSIITLTNGGGGDFKTKSGEKEKKTRENKMTHMVQSSVSLMKSINNVAFLTLLCLKESSHIINPRQKLKAFFFVCVRFLTDLESMWNKCLATRSWYLFSRLLRLWNKLSLALATKTNPQPVYIGTGALALYKQTAPVARGLIRRRPTNPIKSLFVPCSVFVWRQKG